MQFVIDVCLLDYLAIRVFFVLLHDHDGTISEVHLTRGCKLSGVKFVFKDCGVCVVAGTAFVTITRIRTLKLEEGLNRADFGLKERPKAVFS